MLRQLAFALLLLLAVSCAAPAVPTPPGTPGLRQQATVTEVIDGDTIEVELGGETLRVRYYGSDAPERGEACYEEARVLNRSLVDSRVLLEADARDRDRYGRLLRYVFTPQGGSIDAALVQAGLAHAWRRDGKHRNWLMGLEEQARAEGRGCLW